MLQKLFNLAINRQILYNRPNQSSRSISFAFLSHCNQRFCSTQPADDRSGANKLTVKERQIRLIKSDILYCYESGLETPNMDGITSRQWDQMVEMHEKQRRKFYGKIFRQQRGHQYDLLKKEIRKAHSLERKSVIDEEREANGHIIYGVGHNSLLPRISRQTMNKWRHRKILRALLQDSHLIYDCGFEDELNGTELPRLVNGLVQCLSVNRLHRTPFFPHFTNLILNGKLHNELVRVFPCVSDNKFPLRLSENFIPDGIAKERLVYLTPDSPDQLTRFNYDDIYVIGGLVDKNGQNNASIARAKEFSIRTARLPLHLSREWKRKNPSLDVDQVTKVLLELKKTKDMRTALYKGLESRALFNKPK